MKPLVSIITPVYNCEDTIVETIEFMHENNISFLYTDYTYFDEDKKLNKYRKCSKKVQL